VVDIEGNENKGGEANGEPKYIDEGEPSIPEEVSHSGNEIVFQHEQLG
jgi:hypothetical protein